MIMLKGKKKLLYP